MSCIFCALSKNKDIVDETENFYVKVGIGIVTAGHIMIIPKNHYRSIGAIEKDLVDEYLKLKEKTFLNISHLFSEPCLVEYGAYGQSVPHAHVHFIPKTGNNYKDVDLFNNMVLKAQEKLNFNLIKFDGFEKLQEFYEQHQEYIYFEDIDKYIIEVNDNIRNNNISLLSYRYFFTNLGLKGISNWATMTDEDKERDAIKRNITIQEYKKYLKNN